MRVFNSFLLTLICLSIVIDIGETGYVSRAVKKRNRHRIKKLDGEDNVLDLLEICDKNYKSSCLRNILQRAIMAVTRGIPELHIKSLDPLMIRFERMGNGSFQLLFRNGFLSGLKSCKLLSQVDVSKEQVDISLQCSFKIRVNFMSSGQIDMINVDGKGQANINVEKIKIKLTLKLGHVERDGETYLEVEDVDANFEFTGMIDYNGTNVFKKEVSINKKDLEEVNKKIKGFLEKLAEPAVRDGITKIINHIRSLFSQVPANKLKKYFV